MKDKKKVYKIIDLLLQLLDIIDVTAKDIRKAFRPEVDDFEDELISVCAERAKIDYIITRNSKDFIKSPIPAITPEDFITEFFENL